MLSQAVVKRLRRVGNCAAIIKEQLKTINDFTLTIKNIKVQGARATARVQTKNNGHKIVQTVILRHESAGWRLDSVL